MMPSVRTPVDVSLVLTVRSPVDVSLVLTVRSPVDVSMMPSVRPPVDVSLVPSFRIERMKQYIAKMNYIYHHLLMITLSKYN
jgi:hypothetical protein